LAHVNTCRATTVPSHNSGGHQFKKATMGFWRVLHCRHALLLARDVRCRHAHSWARVCAPQARPGQGEHRCLFTLSFADIVQHLTCSFCPLFVLSVLWHALLLARDVCCRHAHLWARVCSPQAHPGWGECAQVFVHSVICRHHAARAPPVLFTLCLSSLCCLVSSCSLSLCLIVILLFLPLFSVLLPVSLLRGGAHKKKRPCEPHHGMLMTIATRAASANRHTCLWATMLWRRALAQTDSLMRLVLRRHHNIKLDRKCLLFCHCAQPACCRTWQ